MKLEIELVPQPLWGFNLRSYFSSAGWDLIRRAVYKNAKLKCEICGKSGIVLHAHEIWEYDDFKSIQKLSGLVSLCEMCHHCKHIGFAAKQANEGKLDYNDVVNHFCAVNRCGEKRFQLELGRAKDLFNKRSGHGKVWTIDLSKLQEILRKLGLKAHKKGDTIVIDE